MSDDPQVPVSEIVSENLTRHTVTVPVRGRELGRLQRALYGELHHAEPNHVIVTYVGRFKGGIDAMFCITAGEGSLGATLSRVLVGPNGKEMAQLPESNEFRGSHTFSIRAGATVTEYIVNIKSKPAASAGNDANVAA